uniref:Uncharacterized protein n=1 Tax=Arundo donax TaxID=35708 RepID=A0A0A9B739_ARUDO
MCRFNILALFSHYFVMA